jgi:hypothetical protein
MRLKLPILALSAALLTSCAYEGTIVQKDATPHPFYLSQGIEGKYAFILQDKAGVRHRQLVTPEVYERYAIGQYFNDLQTAGSTTQDAKGVQQPAPMMTASLKPRTATQRLAVSTAKAKAARIASTTNSAKKLSLATAKAAARKRAVAKSKAPKPVAKPITIAAVASAPKPPVVVAPDDYEFGVFTIARCR